jgi:hypothetical protein
MKQSPEPRLPEEGAQEAVEDVAISLQRKQPFHRSSDSKERNVVPLPHRCDSQDSSPHEPMSVIPSLQPSRGFEPHGIAQQSPGDEEEEHSVLDHSQASHKATEVKFKFVEVFDQTHATPLFASLAS